MGQREAVIGGEQDPDSPVQGAASPRRTSLQLRNLMLPLLYSHGKSFTADLHGDVNVHMQRPVSYLKAAFNVCSTLV